MRPTLLQFRSTKEKTPLSYDAKSTYDGRLLSFNSPKGDPKRRTFSCERRFIAYDILAKRTGYRVGPGSYSPELYKPKIRSGSPYRDLHCQKNTANNGYYMVGNTMEFEPALMLGSKKRFQKDKLIKMDATYISNKMSKSAVTTSHSINVDASRTQNDYYSTGKNNKTYREKKKQVSGRKSMTFNRGSKIQDLIKSRFRPYS